MPPAPRSASPSRTGCPISAYRECRQHGAGHRPAVHGRHGVLECGRGADRARSSRAARCCTRSAPRRPPTMQAAEQYRSTVLTAFQNVADTLTALEQDAEGLKAAAAAADAAKVDAGSDPAPIAGRLCQLSCAVERRAGLSAGATSTSCRPRPAATPTRRRCFRRWAAAGGIAPILERRPMT